MIKKKISEIEVGMVLAQDLYDDAHRLLVAKGTELNDSLISRLSQMGVVLAYVEGEDGPEEDIDARVYEQEFNEIEQRVDEKFRGFLENPVMMQIASCAKRFLKQKVKKETL